MRNYLCLLLSALVLCTASNPGQCQNSVLKQDSTLRQDSKQEILDKDIVLRAMDDELARTMKSLKLPDYPRPYFASYGVVDDELRQVSASFGAITASTEYKSRRPEVSVRVGDKHVDNTFFAPGFFGAEGESFSLDDDYDAIRYGLWLQSDKVYKHAVESLEAVKSRLKVIKIEDCPDCFSDAKPVVSVSSPAQNKADIGQWTPIVRRISAVFRDYPEIKDSSCYLNLRARTTRFVNSEGTLVRMGETGNLFSLSASAQAKDGMEISDSEVFAGDDIESLPSESVLADAARKLSERVIDLSKAKPAEDYQGPVLFEKQAAAHVLSVSVAPRVCARPEAGRLGRDDRKLDKPLLAPAITLIDDPTEKSFQGEILKSGWLVDYEGVKAGKLTLVDKGVLKIACATRTPTALSKESNGHNRGSASPGHLFLSTSEKTSLSDLKHKLIEMGKEEKLDKVVIVRRFSPGPGLGADIGIIGIFMHLGRAAGGTPCLAYLLDLKSGKEELVRGARISEPAKRSLLTMQAASDDAHSYLVSYPTDRSSYTISAVTPSLLFKDMEISKPPQTTEVQPYLKNPFFEELNK